MEIKLEESWKSALKEEFDKPYFKQLIQFISNEYDSNPKQIFPEGKYILRALDLCPLDKVKVVILGQDPYPTRGNANGLCFSVDEHVKPFPKSLINIFKEIEDDLKLPFPENGSLVRWAEQGVLLLNATLTVREGLPESHANHGWEKFTDAIIRAMNERRNGIVYLLWGSKAQQKAHSVNEKTNLILKTVHPSPLSAYRGFFGSKHFSKTNDYLRKTGQSPISW